MKVLLALLACVAVSHAAFTGTLQQRAQPAVAQAMFKVRLVAGRSAVRGELANAISSHLDNLLNQIDALLQQGQDILPGMQEQAASYIEQLQAVGGNAAAAVQEHYNNIQAQIAGHVENAQNAVANAHGWISSLLNTLGLGRGKNLSVITDLLQNLNVATLQNAFAAAWQTIQEEAMALVNSINIHDILQGAFSSFAMQKGWFGDMWNTISGAISQVGSAAWEQVTDTAGSMWGQVTDMYESMTGTASTAFNTVQEIAASFVAEATAVGSTLSESAINQMIDILGTHQAELGEQLWNQVQGVKPQGKKLF